MKQNNELLNARHIYQRVFSTPEGKAVLTDILNDLGFFATDPSYINPEKLAIAHSLLQKIGTNVVQNIGSYVSTIVDCATDTDLIGGENG